MISVFGDTVHFSVAYVERSLQKPGFTPRTCEARSLRRNGASLIICVCFSLFQWKYLRKISVISLWLRRGCVHVCMRQAPLCVCWFYKPSHKVRLSVINYIIQSYLYICGQNSVWPVWLAQISHSSHTDAGLNITVKSENWPVRLDWSPLCI